MGDGVAGQPCRDLYIYYIEGRLEDNPREGGEAYIGNWVEDGYSFLFFSRPAAGAVARMLSSQPGLSLVDHYQMRYEDWLGERFQPFSVGDLLIAPPWDPAPAGEARRRILLDPGVVFGTGTHPTTRDCLDLIQQVCGSSAVRTALDVGTGTGLLALAAASVGCRRVLAFDLNRLAVQTARRNVDLNRLSDVVLAFQGRAEEMALLPADLMIANIHYDVMDRLLASGAVANKSWFILSGLLRSQAEAVMRRLSDAPVDIVERRDQDGIWHTFLGRSRA